MLLKIRELAEKAQVSVDSIRFYEKKNLLQPTFRADNQYRYYDEDALKKLLFIKHCRDLGIAIHEISSLNELLKHPQQNCHAVNILIEKHLQEVNEKILALQQFQTQLQQLRQSCNQNTTVEHCQIIKTLEHL
ncbi:MerR family transcriptional regulator [Acinetobacter populi]|jgi:DNA-binding transcriptional MerR regulator|uniref:Transcriptional regulator n=1 Tax=Acinetobacter populi TaxID=1582270 RepID=A0A1Z9Z320_9GAMM|nr:MerR family transcriptional regulator [Acinetobacter populi]MCH4246658.1 MerR family transcriptional regulator [Acinetobacter populi]OUY08873.1 transcriptional regulator [Acinetobacter populi]